MPDICLLNPTFPFNFEIVRSKRKHMIISVKDGRVEVRAPLYSSRKWIHEFVLSQKNWIQGELAKQRRQLRQRLVIADGREIMLFGKPRTIVVLVSNRQSVRSTRDFLFIHTRSNSPEHMERLFNSWLKGKATEWMTAETWKIAQLLGVDRKLKRVNFRRTRTKWGHCSTDGVIQYNYLTMMAPREVIRYLIVHECSHLRHMDHSRRFWGLVESLCPNYAELRHWLAENGHRFWTRQ